MIEGGTFVTHDGQFRVGGGCHFQRRIVSLTLDASYVDADQRIDLTGLLVSGGIDVPHHFREPEEFTRKLPQRWSVRRQGESPPSSNASADPTR